MKQGKLVNLFIAIRIMTSLNQDKIKFLFEATNSNNFGFSLVARQIQIGS